ncbi:hypothetical protein FRC12_009655 [Ceratobasidium sp. 428]|nr:hypothetical protein FRC12_009655 [Ceratobasidium sp. 428]
MVPFCRSPHVTPKKAKAPAPRQLPPRRQKRPTEKDDDEGPPAPAEPETKKPLDDLPKRNFNLEDWKRACPNMDARGDAGSLK